MKPPSPAAAEMSGFCLLYIQRHCLPVCNVFKHKHCLLILSFMEIRPNSYISLHEGVPNLIINKIGKQGIWRAICEKTPFPISSEVVFLACWVASQTLNTANSLQATPPADAWKHYVLTLMKMNMLC